MLSTCRGSGEVNVVKLTPFPNSTCDPFTYPLSKNERKMQLTQYRYEYYLHSTLSVKEKDIPRKKSKYSYPAIQYEETNVGSLEPIEKNRQLEPIYALKTLPNLALRLAKPMIPFLHDVPAATLCMTTLPPLQMPN